MGAPSTGRSPKASGTTPLPRQGFYSLWENPGGQGGREGVRIPFTAERFKPQSPHLL